MRKILPVLLVLFFAISFTKSEAQTKTYFSSGGEMIFSFTQAKMDGQSLNNYVRWTVFFHASQNYHMNFSPNFGMYAGLALRNVGISYKDLQDRDWVNRSYSAGIPIALKLGSFEKGFFFFGGIEPELMFAYKEKYWQGSRWSSNTKTKNSSWFSDKVNMFNPSWFVGINFPYGLNVKFKYYFYDFMNKDYVDGNGEKPYENFESPMYYFSISYNLKNEWW